jgi:hypothetical protein
MANEWPNSNVASNAGALLTGGFKGEAQQWV